MILTERRTILAGLTAGLLAIAAAAGSGMSARATEPLSVVATTGMIADAARRVGGDLVTATALMGPGVDPHAYRQTRTDIARLLKADLVLWHGLYLEAQMEEFMHGLAERRTVVAVAEAVPAERLRKHDTYENKFDPHIWMDPALWSEAVLAVRDALIRLRPDSATVFEANAAVHLKEIAELEDYARRALATVPESGRVLLTAHDAFGYFGATYGFEVIGIQGISTESEAGLKRISDLVDTLVDRRISAVFVETSVSDRNIRALVEGAAAQGHKVSVGGELFSDAMGADGTYEGSYVGMIDHNVTTITRALGGVAPERGMRGRLAAGT